MKTNDEIKDFIRKHYKHLTLEEMAEELDIRLGRVTKWCLRMGVKALSPAERNYNFVRDHHEKMSVEKMAKVLELNLDYFMKKYGDEFNLHRTKVIPVDVPKIPKPVKKQKNVLTPRQILAGFRLSDAGHYIDPDEYTHLRAIENIK